MTKMKKEKVTWNCDFCDEPGLSISKVGLIYCRFCRQTYQKNLYDLARKLIKEESKEKSSC